MEPDKPAYHGLIFALILSGTFSPSVDSAKTFCRMGNCRLFTIVLMFIAGKWKCTHSGETSFVVPLCLNYVVLILVTKCVQSVLPIHSSGTSYAKN